MTLIFKYEFQSLFFLFPTTVLQLTKHLRKSSFGSSFTCTTQYWGLCCTVNTLQARSGHVLRKGGEEVTLNVIEGYIKPLEVCD